MLHYLQIRSHKITLKISFIKRMIYFCETHLKEENKINQS
jgi:hypothetical protein